ncbi:MAG: hypothetical protein E6R06_26050 [Mycobacterium sp.]|nr:MAG: hypothetical protein E6R06_26050 [Mycobacterium sp.]
MIPGLVTIEFTKDTKDKDGNLKRSKGDRLSVDRKQAEVFIKKGVAKPADEGEPSRHGAPAIESKPDAPSGAS